MARRSEQKEDESRRHFLRDSSMLLASALPTPNSHVSQGSIRVGLLGCGQRGRVLAEQSLAFGGSVCLAGMADLAGNVVQRCFRSLKSRFGSQVAIDGGRFVGPHAAAKLIRSDVDAIVIATPSGLKPALLETAIKAGKHVFLEQPVSVFRDDLSALQRCGKMAESQRLALVVGEETSLFPVDHQMIGMCNTLEAEASVLLPRETNQSIGQNAGVNWRGDEQQSGVLGLEQHIQNILMANVVFGSLPLAGQVVSGAPTDRAEDHSSLKQVALFYYGNGKRLTSRVTASRGAQTARPKYIATVASETRDLARAPRQPRNATSKSLSRFLASIARGETNSNYRHALQTLRVAVETLG